MEHGSLLEPFAWVLTPDLLFSRCMILGKIFNLSAPWIPHLCLLHRFVVETKEISRAHSMVTGNSRNRDHLGLNLPEHLAPCREYRS